MILPEERWAVGAVQLEDGFVLVAHDMYMARAMIVRIDDGSIAQEPQDSCHGIKKPKLVWLLASGWPGLAQGWAGRDFKAVSMSTLVAWRVPCAAADIS